MQRRRNKRTKRDIKRAITPNPAKKASPVKAITLKLDFDQKPPQTPSRKRKPATRSKSSKATRFKTTEKMPNLKKREIINLIEDINKAINKIDRQEHKRKIGQNSSPKKASKGPDDAQIIKEGRQILKNRRNEKSPFKNLDKVLEGEKMPTGKTRNVLVGLRDRLKNVLRLENQLKFSEKKKPKNHVNNFIKDYKKLPRDLNPRLTERSRYPSFNKEQEDLGPDIYILEPKIHKKLNFDQKIAGVGEELHLRSELSSEGETGLRLKPPGWKIPLSPQNTKIQETSPKASQEELDKIKSLEEKLELALKKIDDMTATKKPSKIKVLAKTAINLKTKLKKARGNIKQRKYEESKLPMLAQTYPATEAKFEIFLYKKEKINVLSDLAIENQVEVLKIYCNRIEGFLSEQKLDTDPQIFLAPTLEMYLKHLLSSTEEFKKNFKPWTEETLELKEESINYETEIHKHNKLVTQSQKFEKDSKNDFLLGINKNIRNTTEELLEKLLGWLEEYKEEELEKLARNEKIMEKEHNKKISKITKKKQKLTPEKENPVKEEDIEDLMDELDQIEKEAENIEQPQSEIEKPPSPPKKDNWGFLYKQLKEKKLKLPPTVEEKPTQTEPEDQSFVNAFETFQNNKDKSDQKRKKAALDLFRKAGTKAKLVSRLANLRQNPLTPDPKTFIDKTLIKENTKENKLMQPRAQREVQGAHQGAILVDKLKIEDLKTSITCMKIIEERKIALGCVNGFLYFFDLKTQQIRSCFAEHTSAVSVLEICEFKADEKESSPLLLSGSASPECCIIIWDLKKNFPAKRLTGHEAGISAIQPLFNKSTVVVSSYDGTLSIWELGFSFEQVQLLDQHNSPILCVDYSPEEHTLLSGALNGSLIKWEVVFDRGFYKGCRLLTKLRMQGQPVLFCRSQKLSGSVLVLETDFCIRLYSLNSGCLVKSFKAPDPILDFHLVETKDPLPLLFTSSSRGGVYKWTEWAQDPSGEKAAPSAQLGLQKINQIFGLGNTSQILVEGRDLYLVTAEEGMGVLFVKKLLIEDQK